MKHKILLLLIISWTSCSALFEDQVGKFDWTARHLGCYNQVHFGRSESAEEFLLVSSEKNTVGRLNVNTGDLVWRQINEQTAADPPTFTVTDSDIIVSINNGLYSRTFDKNTGVLKTQKRGQAADTAGQSEAILKVQKPVERSMGFAISTVQSVDSHPNYYVAQSAQGTHVCRQASGGAVEVLLTVDRANVFAVSDKYNPSAPTDSPVDLLFAAYYEAQRIVRIYDLSTKKDVVDLRLVSSSSSSVSSSLKQAPVKSIHFLASVTGSYQILVTREDCEVDFYEATVNNINEARSQGVVDANLEWVRFEGLASISSVEMVDLPLSESQARIETEFGSVNVPIWKSFLLRISSQLEQLQRAFVGLGNRVVESFEMFTSKRATMASVLRHLLGYDERRARRRSNGQDKGMEMPATIAMHGEEGALATPLERDYFNLKKMIVATTLSGSVYGISNDNGEVIWSLYLGEESTPFRDQLMNPKIPLYIMRSTNYFQYPSQAAAVCSVQGSRKSKIVFFNPITGSMVNTIQVDDLKRLEMLPFANAEMMHPLLILRADDKLEFYPSIEADYTPPYPIHLMFLEKSGLLRGVQVDFQKRVLVENWKSDLGFTSPAEKIEKVAAKSNSQKVHSQGKVLGDRTVLYKYANPNLVALAAVDEEHSSLTIFLVDSVSGQVVYTARHPRSHSPINLVHCENWLVYTYWNVKARRTELGVVELYEGLVQTNSKNFNSYTTLKHPLTVFAQSYIFSQGVAAMAVSETEQGLTTRSVIIAMPFGGVMEMSRRLIDARRPLELTPEMREEMIIPYMPELMIATEDLINYNQTVHNINGIKTASSGLESTSLVFVYGLDLFYTRVTPSGTFDILKEDFDFVLISLVMVVLIVASVMCKKIWRNQSLKQAWK